ncbi:cytochrome C biogenesis protein ResB [Thioalkalivibrio denitrificans]|uniref:Cytochrome C biogenesis protein ResB n=1 Tax=Thioalkalivibrio denitrificans TaxID=108003 RepID=A0A1V3ND35_9GAMM|nr:cytochrome c biogenesis protein ResB [Thioalkalivibrio denitrificans]OOG22955.1 cytochrome C biogenesis protein ResB [Thioalkalivibrio denitrificans]
MSSTTVETRRQPRGRSTTVIVLEFLGSMNLAITLLVAVGIASIIGTVLEQNRPYQEYLLNFGPFWHEIFAGMALYDVYSAGWFLFIMTFLVTSTAVCVYRHAPSMIREMRQFRLSVKEKSLRSFRHNVALDLESPPDAVLDRARRALTSRGYRVRVKDHGDHQVMSAMKGATNRLGYLFTHVAIVVICVGALLDGRMPLKLAELTGRLVVETRDIPASQVPAISRLGPNNPSFRGGVELAEGQSAGIVFITVRDGYVVQELPFRVEVREFRMEHFDTGTPRLFESDLVIYDDDLDEPLEHTIRVNHPLIYKGHAIYQASFADGGSELNFNIWPFGPRGVEPVQFEGKVFENYPMEVDGHGNWLVEIMNLEVHNSNRFIDDDGKAVTRHLGPSVHLRLRNQAGESWEFENYMYPVEEEGRLFFLSGMREDATQEFRFLHIPVAPGHERLIDLRPDQARADHMGDPVMGAGPGPTGIERFMTFQAMLSNPEVIERVVQQSVTSGAMPVGDEAMQTQVAQTMGRLLNVFAQGGYDALAHEIETRTPPDQVEQVTDVFVRVLHAGLQALYLEVLAEEGVEQISEADMVFLEDAVSAINAARFYGAPVFFQLADFNHIEASGLMITKAPYKNVVYFGSAMLTLGIFLLFYVAHRRVWVWVKPGEQGSRAVLAGTSNRNMVEFGKEFQQLSAAALGHRPGADTQESPEKTP